MRHALCTPRFTRVSAYPSWRASGCPLALSDASCFPEVARDGGAYFDPYNVESMADTMRRLISDTHLCETLVARGREILASYSWDKMARETAAVYSRTV